mmetsp:Transcript_45724/g.106137  ORF Transcript_45724/g.106137 Transcript_45724/m.106137 type:complete len:219 (+) Transcript_45724:2771-3427(+)
MRFLHPLLHFPELCFHDALPTSELQLQQPGCHAHEVACIADSLLHSQQNVVLNVRCAKLGCTKLFCSVNLHLSWCQLLIYLMGGNQRGLLLCELLLHRLQGGELLVGISKLASQLLHLCRYLFANALRLHLLHGAAESGGHDAQGLADSLLCFHCSFLGVCHNLHRLVLVLSLLNLCVCDHRLLHHVFGRVRPFHHSLEGVLKDRSVRSLRFLVLSGR